MPLLAGRRLLVTGVLTDPSIACAVAAGAQREGAEVVLTGFGRSLRLTERIARRLPEPADVLELDVDDDEQLAALHDALDGRWGALDGVLHATACAPPAALGGAFLATPAASAERAFRTTAFSFKALAGALLPLLERGTHAGLVALDFDASVAWPAYDFAGVAKAALESINRYLARDLGGRGIRANLVSAGPLRTMAANAIPGFDELAGAWERQAPLGWDPADADAVAEACLWLLSERARAVTGEIVHVDGGYHAMGAPLNGTAAPDTRRGTTAQTEPSPTR